MRYILNLIISCIWLWLFQQWGWLTFTTGMEPGMAIFATAFIASLVSFVVNLLIAMVIVGSCGIAVIALPLIWVAQGWLILWGTANATHWFNINESFFWTGLLMSFLFGVVRIPSVEDSSSS